MLCSALLSPCNSQPASPALAADGAGMDLIEGRQRREERERRSTRTRTTTTHNPQHAPRYIFEHRLGCITGRLEMHELIGHRMREEDARSNSRVHVEARRDTSTKRAERETEGEREGT